MRFEQNMGSEPSSGGQSSTTPSPSSSGKRSRDPEDELYLDNLHSHKRYLSEIMASSLNGLTVGDQLTDNLMDSPARSDSMFFLRDEMSLQYSPMSEDSDDSRFTENAINACSSHADSIPSSPVSPYRYQRPTSAFPFASSSGSNSSHGCGISSVNYSHPHPRQRGSDSEGRFPSSPSDICHSADLRRAALLRSVQMRTQPPGSSSFDLPFISSQESMPNLDAEERPCSFLKASADEQEYQVGEHSSMGISRLEFHQEKPCKVLNISDKRDSSEG